jgi:hypothetical protein
MEYVEKVQKFDDKIKTRSFLLKTPCPILRINIRPTIFDEKFRIDSDNKDMNSRHETAEVSKIQVYGRTGDMVAKLQNLSATGARLELINGEYVPKRGDFLHITVHLHSINKTHEVDAEVMWNEGLGFGINFIKREQLMFRLLNRSKEA